MSIIPLSTIKSFFINIFCNIINYEMMFLYGIISSIVFYLSLPFYYAERIISGKSAGWKEKFAKQNMPINADDKVIMLHGVSVGEVIALENLAKQIKTTFPDYKLAVTTGTKTGQEIAHKKYAQIADYITYFPFDIPKCTDKFLTKLHPNVVLIAETELWPNFANSCKKNNIPLFIINGRISDSTFTTYKLAKLFFKQVFKNFTAFLMQSKEDADKILTLGANKDKISVMGNLKFDIQRKEADIDLGQKDYRVIIAGSTHKGEDEILLEVFKNLKKEFNDIKLLIAPRHLQRTSNVIELIKSTEYNYGLRSQNNSFIEKDIIILDTLGELSKMYSICTFAFIGGSFNNTGGHNPLESVVYNKPAISGPSIHNFKDIYEILGRTNAGKVVKSANELGIYMKKLLSNKEFYAKACKDCESVFDAQKGALDFVIQKLKSIL